MERGSSWGDRIERPILLPPPGDQTGLSQVGKVSGGRRLRDLEDRHEIADAQLAPTKEVQNTQPQRIRERFEHPVNGGPWHIRIGELEFRRSMRVNGESESQAGR